MTIKVEEEKFDIIINTVFKYNSRVRNREDYITSIDAIDLYNGKKLIKTVTDDVNEKEVVELVMKKRGKSYTLYLNNKDRDEIEEIIIKER